MKRMGAVVAAAAVMFLGASCGVGDDFSKFGDRMKIAGGDTDPSLLGTFRLFPSTGPARGMFTLLILNADMSFFGRYVAWCDAEPCTGTVDVTGSYEQRREMPNIGRAAGVILHGRYLDPASQADVGVTMVLKRGLVEGSPLVSLYHETSTDGDFETPFFMFIHDDTLFCQGPSDCDRQGTQSCGNGWSCESNECRCP